MVTATAVGRTIVKEVTIAATPERIYQALTAKDELEAWFVAEARSDPRPDGELMHRWAGETEETIHGRYVVVDPPRRLVFEWDERPTFAVTTIDITLTPVAGGTRLRLVHSGIGEGGDWDRWYGAVDDGWSEELENLRRWIEETRGKGSA